MLKLHLNNFNSYRHVLRYRVKKEIEIEIAFAGIVSVNDGTNLTRTVSAM